MNRQTRSRSICREEVKALPYYYENFNSTDEVANYIKKKAKGKVGSFILRPSNRNRDLLTASVLVPDNSVRHTHIQIEENGTISKFFLVVEKKFDSIHELMEFYARNPIKNLENVNNVYFQRPIYRPDLKNMNSFPSTGSIDSHGSGMHRTFSTSSQGSGQSNGHAGPPPLPIRPVDSTGSLGSSASSGLLRQASSTTTLDRRPPLPLPTEAQKSGDSNPYYSQARDVSEDISGKLKEVLKSSERCECGIPRILAELPMGWTIHLSKDPQTAGRLFYQNNDGLTSWNLPERVRMQLTKTHMSNLATIEQKFGSKKMVKKNSLSEVHDV